MTGKKPETLLVNVGREKKYTQGAVNSIIQRTSSVIFDTVEDMQHALNTCHEGTLFYGRRGTMTHFALQDAMTKLEGGAGCALYPSGTAAITHSILSFVKTGDHVLMVGNAYEPTQSFCNKFLQKMGISTDYFDPMIGEDIARLIKPNTTVLFLESPGSLTMEVQDVPAIVRATRQVNPEIVIMIDNTWSAGVLFKALEFGVDISIQSATKYIIGHSDGMLGTAVANTRCWDQLRERSYLMGQVVDPDTAYMAVRGLHTLATRLRQHEENSIKIAQWLAQRPEVAEVYHPALPSCPGHIYFKRDFTGSCGLFSFLLKTQLTPEQVADYLDNMKHFKMAFSWGGFESLILEVHPKMLKALRKYELPQKTGTLIRLHIGLEDRQDLIDDLEAGFVRLENY
ncbi:cystathionine beta-lyase, PLP-dependent (beta-cystathionase) [Xenorhabdus nematophila ATCC 19061]|uniref:Cystathionine beta-lyase, PLP-dependent (Beta-cystathionase) n=1 Tax=Xenorhabdus nematophila (strain ATCC 19061 / DSM 3370 / CCUG 14189 / LMG 1036 / NCIMB 9965 / AN6) TaxID=406817 RepID=D3VB18_XENNA|nr:cystathionine beta-lyase [Xenorhabdus nematophila]CBJ91793.1 cystathionine beta-lyase, PLP-dependent (beta-cystathionase) [Xenorhabdus nematophila ATCC 19061]CEE90546.1 cystathionine beta-lyase, PLP-dependent (beta-cystathionase) [Xenorhabdus nematophila str. Anatoliense]CEE91318.1 cystathionine beta-lyase, PLP-dependent (beta-cystathionase) [Xenorhabdus nematophila str. Anatoliense]CEK24611.1 cystathionine beta-lyase, PLP-dependent (beta-cystathionase) [Xenorhabdus nematophila AN6/1]